MTDGLGTNEADMIPAWVDGALRPVGKIAAHRLGVRHKAVSVFVLHRDRLLIQRRALGKYHTPGLWANTCCTHPHWGEAPEACAHRRLTEELGIAGLDLTHRDTIEYRADVGDGMTEHEVVDLFTARVDARPPLSPNPAEVLDLEWIALADLERQIARTPGRFTPWLRIYMDRHAATILA